MRRFHGMATLRRVGQGMGRGLLLLMAGLTLGTGGAHAATTVTVTLVMTDAQGNVLMTKDVHGNILARYTYRPYGTQQSGPTNHGPGYTGHVNDPATGLVYMQQRYYDPEVGRFISPDPVAPAPGNIFNFGRYTYANDNPIRFTDPDGRCPDTPFGCGSLLNAHAQWRMSHPNAPPDALEKAAFAGIGVMLSASGLPEVAGLVKLVRMTIKSRPKVTKGTKNVDSLINDSKPGRVTKGRTKQFDRSGGLDQANKDFDELNPSEVRNIPGGRVGKLEDGRTVIVRNKSSDGRPTLEIQQSKNKTKFRFDD